MPRPPRRLPPEGMIHLISRSNNQVALCKDEQDFTALKKRLSHYTQFYEIKVHHYVIMRTHVHMLAFVQATSHLPLFFKAFQISYFHYFKKKYGYSGHLWHGRYRSVPVFQNIHSLQAGRYIELNPVKALVAKHPSDYPWCSYHFYAHGREDILVTTNPQYLDWGDSQKDRCKKYRSFIMSDGYFE